MKKVFSSHSELCHAFSSRQYPEGSGSNMLFDADTIYSYGRHFPIARIVDEKKKILLFTTRGYSNSTSKHKVRAARALSHFDFIYIPNPRGTVSENAEEMIRDCERFMQKAQKARQRRPEYIGEVFKRIENFERYISVCKLRPAREDVAKFRLFKNLLTDESGLKKWADIKTREILKEQKRRAKEEIESRAKWAAEMIERRAKFIAGEKMYGATVETETGGCMLRYLPESNEIESSKWYRVNADSARRLYSLWKKSAAYGEELDNFKVHESTAAGIKIGCHIIESAEIERLAKLLNW